MISLDKDMPNLYAGKVLYINLSEKTICKKPTAPLTKQFLGGRGINIKLVYDHIEPKVDPFAPGNVLVLGTGPLTGTCPSSGRMDVMAKSPMTQLLGNSNMGGYFSPELKFAGYDHVVIEGKAEHPTYIYIENDHIEFKDASDLWGKDVYQTPVLIKDELNKPEAKVVCIGPGGENLVRFATLQSELGNGAGRTGMGAVMGSKNLKAIAVRGTQHLNIAHPAEYLELCSGIEAHIKASQPGQELAQWGTTRIMDRMIGDGGWQHNFQKRGLQPEATVPMNLFKKYSPQKVGCFGCPNRCMEYYDIEGQGSGVISCAFYVGTGITVDNPDPETWWKGAIFCQRQGIDIDSVGGILAWAMELFQRGIITKKDTDGIAMEWGGKEAILETLENIVARRGFGDILADGMVIGARKIGRGSAEFAMHTKGLPIIEDPITLRGMSLGTAVGPRGDMYRSYPTIEEGMHTIDKMQLDSKQLDMAKDRMLSEAEQICGTQKGAIPKEYEGKSKMICDSENQVAVTDSLGICKWVTPWYGVYAYTTDRIVQMLSMGLGVKFNHSMLVDLANRIRCLERSFDAREGLRRSHDTLPKRMFKKEVNHGEQKNEVLDLQKFELMKTDYYIARGWDPQTGIPAYDTLSQYGLDYVADDLKKHCDDLKT